METSNHSELEENGSDLDEEIAQVNNLQINDQSLQYLHPAQTEITHLQKRIQSLTFSLQSSQGLSNPQIWNTNVLLAVKNCLLEWRGICRFHFSEGALPPAENVVGTESAHDVHQCKTEIPSTLLRTTSTEVYNLLQMAMQSGPLTGSNPGYFKRCGSEVASIALGFLMEIVALAAGEERGEVESDVGNEVNCVGRIDIDVIHRDRDISNFNASVDASERTDGNGNIKSAVDTTCVSSVDGGAPDDEKDQACSEGCENNVESAVGDDVENNSDSSSCSDDSSRSDSSSSSETSQEQCNTSNKTLSMNNNESSLQTQSIQALQNLHFSHKQCQRIHEWIVSAQRAIEANKPPSKSAKKIQSQKSKKQKMKELKMQRKIKKKKRGGGK